MLPKNPLFITISCPITFLIMAVSQNSYQTLPNLFLFLSALNLSRFPHILPCWESQDTLLYLIFLYTLICLFPSVMGKLSTMCSQWHSNLFTFTPSFPHIFSLLHSSVSFCSTNKHFKNLLDLKIALKKELSSSSLPFRSYRSGCDSSPLSQAFLYLGISQ